MSDVTLTVNNARYSGWKTISVSPGIEQMAGTFELSVSERWPGQPVTRPIKPGMPCTIDIDDEVVITGYVDDREPSYDAKSHTVTIRGRDKTADLVDCSAIHKTGAWQNRNLLQIAQDLCAPFGVKVIVETDIGAAFAKWSLQEGESVFECLSRAARFRGVLLTSDGLGNLVITRASKRRVSTPLVYGENIKGGSGTDSWRDRYSDYIVKGENAGSDFSTPEQNSQSKGEAKDPEIDRYRPLIVMAEDMADASKLAERARWEASVRRGKGKRTTINVQGWKHANGVWRPNWLVPVRDDFLDLDRDLLITACTYTKGKDGTLCALTLAPPEAFDLLPLPEPKEEKAF